MADHLSVLASDPQAKAELMQLMEPQRKLFADWAAMMQNGLHGTYGRGASPKSGQPHNQSASAAAAAPTTASAAASTLGAEAAADAFDDSALRLAQLAHRTAQLENRVSELERSLASSFTKGGFSKPKSSSKIADAHEKPAETARGSKPR